MQMTVEKSFKEDSLNTFTILFYGDACEVLGHSQNSKKSCRSSSNYDGILTKGIEQTITKMGSAIGEVIEEINSIKENMPFHIVISAQTFKTYEYFIQTYYQMAYMASE